MVPVFKDPKPQGVRADPFTNNSNIGETLLNTRMEVQNEVGEWRHERQSPSWKKTEWRGGYVQGLWIQKVQSHSVMTATKASVSSLRLPPATVLSSEGLLCVNRLAECRTWSTHLIDGLLTMPKESETFRTGGDFGNHLIHSRFYILWGPETVILP